MRFYLLLILITISSLGFSQSRSETYSRTEQESAAAAILELQGGISEKFVINTWKSFLKDFDAKVKKSRKSKDYVAENCFITDISDDVIALHMEVNTGKDGGEMMLWVNSDDAFYTMESGKMQNVESFLLKFGKKLMIELKKEEIAKEEKILKKQVKALERLVREKKGFEKDIDKAEKTIEKRKKSIIDNEKDQVTTEKSIDSQKSIVDKLKGELSDMQ